MTLIKTLGLNQTIKQLEKLIVGEEVMVASSEIEKELEDYIGQIRESGFDIGKDKKERFGYKIMPSVDDRKRLVLYRRPTLK